MMSKFLDILKDIVVLLELLVYLFYSYIDSLIRNLLPTHKTQKNVQGQVVLITGAGNFKFTCSYLILILILFIKKAGGIGSNLVKRFFDCGSTLLCVDKDKNSLDRLKSDLFKKYSNDFSNEILNKRLKFYVVDIRSVNDVKDFASNVKNEFKNVDILIK